MAIPASGPAWMASSVYGPFAAAWNAMSEAKK